MNKVNLNIEIDLESKIGSQVLSALAAVSAGVWGQKIPAMEVPIAPVAEEPAAAKVVSTEDEKVSEIAPDKPVADDGSAESGQLIEEELMMWQLNKLIEVLNDRFGVDPDQYPGKNTNKKLRSLILDAQAGTLMAPPTLAKIVDSEASATPAAEKPATPAAEKPATPAAEKPAVGVSLDDIRIALVEKREHHRVKIQEKMAEYGAPSISKVPEAKRAEFLNFLNSL